jgi:glycerol-1-phosphate dehydrogenase [NAD(P)+]
MLYPSNITLDLLEKELGSHDAVPVAVGSGTINDLVKLASHRTGRRYMCVSTAASVDGYAAFGAIITVDGNKQNIPCPAPLAIVGDLDILCNAPGAMTASGYGDLLGKIHSGACWMVADAMGVEAIDPYAWEVSQGSLREWLSEPEKVAAGDPKAIENLLEGLTFSGFSIQAFQSSRPGSGAEHMFSHLWEMQHVEKEGLWLSHGFKVGLGSIASAAFYEKLLDKALDRVDTEAFVASWPNREELARRVEQNHSDPAVRKKALEETLAKYSEPDEIRRRHEILRKTWPDLRDKLSRQLITADETRDKLLAVGSPTTPEEIGLTREEMKKSYSQTQQIRKRYVVLDLAVETGVFEECVEELFSEGGFWST